MEAILAFLSSHRLLFSIVCVLGFAFCLKFLFTGKKPEVKAQKIRKKIHGKSHAFYQWKELCSKAVTFAARIPVLGDTLKNLSFSYVCEFAISQENANYMAGRSLLIFAGSFLFSFLGCMLWFKDIVMSVIASTMISMSVLSGVRSKPAVFLTNMQDAIDDFIHAYHTHHENLDEAFHSVIQSTSPVSGHFSTMYEYIQRADVSANPESIQKEYYAIAPARILRQLYSIIYMTYKYGDEEVDRQSQFTKNVFELQKSIADQIYSQKKLEDGTYGVRWFIVLPMFALPFLSKYMLDYFSFEGFDFVESFINSPWGYATMVLCAGISLLCFLLFDKMVQSNVLETKRIVSWENKLLRKTKIRKIVTKFSPKEKARIRLQTHIMRAGSTETIEALTIRRLVTTVLVFVVCLFSVSINVLGTISTITNNVYQGLAHDQYYQILLTQDDVEDYIDEQTIADKQVLSYIKTVKGFDNLTKEEQTTTIRQYMKDNKLDYRGYTDYATQRILSKHLHIAQSGGIMNVLFVIIFTMVAYFTPLLVVYTQSFLNKDMLISDETMDLQTLTVMLISHSSCTPQQLMSWFTSSTVLFQSVFQQTMINGNFEPLRNYVDYKPFNQLVQCLELSYSGMSMDDAFSDIGQKRLIQEKERSRTDEKNVLFRINVIDFFSNIAMGAVLGLYMFMPILIAMFFMFMNMASQMA